MTQPPRGIGVRVIVVARLGVWRGLCGGQAEAGGDDRPGRERVHDAGSRDRLFEVAQPQPERHRCGGNEADILARRRTEPGEVRAHRIIARREAPGPKSGRSHRSASWPWRRQGRTPSRPRAGLRARRLTMPLIAAARMAPIAWETVRTGDTMLATDCCASAGQGPAVDAQSAPSPADSTRILRPMAPPFRYEPTTVKVTSRRHDFAGQQIRHRNPEAILAFFERREQDTLPCHHRVAGLEDRTCSPMIAGLNRCGAVCVM